MSELIIIAAIVYIIGAYIAAFANGYFESSAPDGVIAFWPFYVLCFLVIGALFPFVWVAMWLYSAGSALRDRR